MRKRLENYEETQAVGRRVAEEETTKTTGASIA